MVIVGKTGKMAGKGRVKYYVVCRGPLVTWEGDKSLGKWSMLIPLRCC